MSILKNIGTAKRVKLGFIRYASTNRKFQEIDDVPVFICPADLLSQKSALFGMTRTGKSNTTKIIAKSVYELRYPHDSSDKPLKIGQVILILMESMLMKTFKIIIMPLKISGNYVRVL